MTPIMKNPSAEIFVPLLQTFCAETAAIGIVPPIPAIFLPHTMPNYAQAARKIFYFGRDTKGWLSMKKLMTAYQDQNLEGYLTETEKWARKYGFLKHNQNKATSFWTLVIRLHLRIKGFSENLWISKDLPREYYAQIDDFGWGNTNAIEVPASLNARGEWPPKDQAKYWELKEKSKTFDKLRHTIQAYRPDLVFIFNWAGDAHAFFEGMEFQEKRLGLIKNHFVVYLLPETGTRVIWTVHPTAARFRGYGTDAFIEEILGYLEGLE